MKNPLKFLLPRRFFEKAPLIPVVKLEGVIAAKGSRMQSVLSLENCAALLEQAFSAKRAPAVALIINSPGGSPVQSRLIFRRIRALAAEHKKKTLVFVEDVAASGGYMIACAGDEIYADPSSIVGSIGVVSASFGFPELLKKIGVERRVYTAGKNKASLDPFSKAKAADIAHLKNLQLQIHDVFINLVRESRGARLHDDGNLFTGMFWTGIEGKKLGLVDALGDIRAVLREKFGDKAEMELIEPPRNIFGQVKQAAAVRHWPAASGGGEADFAAALGQSAVESALHQAEARSLYARYGL